MQVFIIQVNSNGTKEQVKLQLGHPKVYLRIILVVSWRAGEGRREAVHSRSACSLPISISLSISLLACLLAYSACAFYLCVHAGIIIAVAIMGPATAFAVGGIFTRIYVTLEGTWRTGIPGVR